MILIGESGATKIDWRLIDDAKIQQFQQKGFNAATHDPAVFLEEIKMLVPQPKDIVKFYFYAAGIIENENHPIAESVQKIFTNASVEVGSDLLAAARGLCGNKPGMAGILGTGANLCEYDGEKIVNRIPPLGYILGDEGGGSYIGRKLVARYIRNQFGGSLMGKIREAYPELNESTAVKKVYGEPSNAYLASFSRFVIENQDDLEIYQLAHRCFHDYFDAFDMKTSLPYHFTGSIAYLLGNILRKVAAERGITLDLIVQSPIAGLTLYHQENG